MRKQELTLHWQSSQLRVAQLQHRRLTRPDRLLTIYLHPCTLQLPLQFHLQHVLNFQLEVCIE